jgi:DNA-binding NtrC family response regulator
MKTQARILVVDDEQGMCQVLQGLLEPAGYEVECAYNATSALAKLKEGPFQLVLADIMMPEIDGIELLQRIKASDESIAVILITAYASLRSAIRAVKYQADGYLTKPLASRRALLDAVASTLADAGVMEC